MKTFSDMTLQTHKKMAANFPGWQKNMDISHCLSTKIGSNVTPLFRGRTWRRGKYHHQHMNAECHYTFFLWELVLGPATHAKRRTCPNGAVSRRAWIIPECCDRLVSAWNCQSGQSVSQSIRSVHAIIGSHYSGGQLKYSSLVSMETTQGICFFSLKRGSSDQDSKLVATM